MRASEDKNQSAKANDSDDKDGAEQQGNDLGKMRAMRQRQMLHRKKNGDGEGGKDGHGDQDGKENSAEEKKADKRKEHDKEEKEEKADEKKAGGGEKADEKKGDGKEAEAKGDGKEAEAEADPNPPGTTGILIKAVGKADAGTPVKVVKTEGKTMQVTTLAGEEQLDTTVDNFKYEPGVATDEVTGKPRDDEYETYKAPLWGPGGPKESDIYQGNIGDCYAMSAMAALAQKDPGRIQQLFSPTTPGADAYSVSLYSYNQKDGSYSPVTLQIDANFPSLKGQKQQPAYAESAEGAESRATEPAGSVPEMVLWPMLLEKAYAEAVGGYDVEGQGGDPAVPLSMFTGVTAESNAPDSKTVLDKFKKFATDGEAVCVGTNDGGKDASAGGFTKAADGSFKAMLGDDGAVLEPSTVKITDTKSAHKSELADDGKGAMLGDNLAKGSVDYGGRAVDLEFKPEAGPDAPDNLLAAYRFEGLISKEFNLYGPHAYTFDRLEGENIILRNPWGFSDPLPIPATRFCEFFDIIDDVKLGQPAAPAGGAAAPAK